MGRPTKLRPAAIKATEILAESGYTNDQIAEALGVSRQTVHNWRGRSPDFLYALKKGKDFADEIVEASLFERAIGYSHPEEKVFNSYGKIITHTVTKHHPPDTLAQIFWLKNRRPHLWRDRQELDLDSEKQISPSGKRSFSEFCTAAGYPSPFEKQFEMRLFAFQEECIRLLLGSRGYGKTDYVTILGVAYQIYLDPSDTTLIVTKSKSRNTAIVNEIATALEKNDVTLTKKNSTEIRVLGLKGKDSNVSMITIKSSAFRGRHPKRVIMDDPVTPEDVSEATRLAAKRCYSEIVKLTQNVLVIGQPVHKYDLFEEIRPIVKRMEVPYGSIPELDPDLEAMRLAGVEEASIQASYFLKILSEGATPFESLNYIDQFQVGDSVAFIDPSHEGGDYTALSIVRNYMQGIQVVGFVWQKAWNHCVDDFAPLLTKYGVKRVCFETNALGDSPIIALRQIVGDGIGVVGRRSTNNKHSRIMAAGQYAHMIHLSKESHRTYIDHVVKYEYKSKYDDAPDSLATCMEWLGLIRGKQ